MKSSITQIEKEQFKKIKMSLMTLMLVFVAHFTFAQTIHTVDNRSESGAMYTSLSAAISAATAGDTIYIHPSPTSYGNIFLNKTITFIGLGHNPANEGGLRAKVDLFDLNAGITNNSVFKGLQIGSIRASGSVNANGIQIINNLITSSISASQADDWVIEGNYIPYLSDFTAISGGIGNTENWLISNNWIRGRISSFPNTTVIVNNIFLKDKTINTLFISCSSPIVANNIFLFTSTATGVGLSNSTINFQNCLTYSYAGIVLTPLGDGTGGNIDNTDPLFTNVPPASVSDFYNNDYSLTAGSAGAGAGTDTTDLGLYGRSFNFDPDGRPDLIPYPTFINITNTVIAPGQNLNVQFKASIKQ